jgi:C-terminal processing protease CtpA/Prc
MTACHLRVTAEVRLGAFYNALVHTRAAQAASGGYNGSLGSGMVSLAFFQNDSIQLGNVGVVDIPAITISADVTRVIRPTWSSSMIEIENYDISRSLKWPEYPTLHQSSIVKILSKLLCALLMACLISSPGWCQHITNLERERAQTMLRDVASDVRHHYFDPKLRGVDWDAKVQEAREKIAKATSWQEATLDIAAAMEALDDSHTFFHPPSDPIPEDYGWRFQMVGNRCFVTHVRPKSDAETKGLKPGDEVLTINGFTLTRESLSKIEYVVYTLVPQSSLQVEVRDPKGKIRQVDVKAKVRQPKAFTDVGDMTGRDSWSVRLENEDEWRRVRPRYKELGPKLMIMKLPGFLYPDLDIEEMLGKARKHSSLILDLRGDSGGAEPTLQDLLSEIFEDDVKIADRVARDTTKPEIAKSSHRNAFTGKLIVLVDSESASASELFARVVQLGKRGTILGDRSSGSVMEARHYSHQTGSNPMFFYGTSVSEADLIMADGKSLEHTGVLPDEVVLPGAADLANDRDPVMSRAAEILGVTLSPEEAGTLFPFEWPKN